MLARVVFSGLIIIFTGCSNLLSPEPKVKIVYRDKIKIVEKRIPIKPKAITHNIHGNDGLDFKYSKCNGILCVCDRQLKRLLNFTKKIKQDKQELLDIIDNHNNNI
jgi:hypothetical protein